LNISKINEPGNLSRINDFKAESIGLVFSFGVGYGGEKTLGDVAYIHIVDNNYIEAYETFKLYKNSARVYNKSKIDDMIEFSKNQIPYQLYNNAMDFYSNGEFNKALELLNKISYKDDIDLDYKIKSIKYIIADNMISDFNDIQESYSIDYKIQYYKDVRDISPKIRDEVNKRLSLLYLEKGDYLLNNNNHEEAYEFYMYSKTTGHYNPERIKIKLSNLITSILNDAYNFLEKKEDILAYEKLFFAKKIANDNNEYINSLIDILDSRINTLKLDKTKHKMRLMLKDKREYIPDGIKKEILIGDSPMKVIQILGKPVDEIDRKKINTNYKIMKYSIDNKIYIFFFKDETLIDIDFE